MKYNSFSLSLLSFTFQKKKKREDKVRNTGSAQLKVLTYYPSQKRRVSSRRGIPRGLRSSTALRTRPKYPTLKMIYESNSGRRKGPLCGTRGTSSSQSCSTVTSRIPEHSYSHAKPGADASERRAPWGTIQLPRGTKTSDSVGKSFAGRWEEGVATLVRVCVCLNVFVCVCVCE